MPKLKITFKTFSPATTSTRRNVAASAVTLLAALLTCSAPSSSEPLPASPTLTQVLQGHLTALHSRGARVIRVYEKQGQIIGLGLRGQFHEWKDGDRERRDDLLGIRSQRQLRVGDTSYVENESGDVRVLHGLLARRQVTEDAVDSGAFAAHPEYCTLLGPGQLYDGRSVIRVRVSPPGGESYVVAFDASTLLIDEKSYVDGDAEETIDLKDYVTRDGLLVPLTEIDSSGDHKFDITSLVTHVRVNEPIAASIFAPFQQTVVAAETPAEVPTRSYRGLVFTNVQIDGRTFTFLVDSGAQAIVIDPSVARTLNLRPEGVLQIRGATRTTGNGVVALSSIGIGTATLPVHVASVVDLSHLLDSGIQIDGILGYPFFAAAEVRIDPDHGTMIVARPGTLPARGTALPVDTDRQLLEVDGRVDDISGRFFIDTGNAGELLIFKPFLDAHPGKFTFAEGEQIANRGIGGSSSAISAIVDELDLGGYRLYNRYGNMILASAGAFADRNDAGNIGYGVLKNFVATFDLASHELFLERARTFDDGRYRSVQERAVPP